MKNKGLIFGGAMVAVVVILYLVVSVFKKKKTETANDATTTDNGQISHKIDNSGQANNTSIFPLKRGSNNDAVKYIKLALNYIAAKKHIAGVNLITTVDANAFGSATEDALMKVYGVKTINKTLAKRMAIDADIPEFSLVLNNFN